jgi:hypothetical protein
MTQTLFVTSQYMGQLKKVMDPKRKEKLRKNAEERLGKLHDSPMVELHKLENEVARNDRLNSIERFMIHKRIRTLSDMVKEAMIMEAVASGSEALAIGGRQQKCN